MSEDVHRRVVVEPTVAEYGSPGKAGLAVSRHEKPGPRGTKYTVDQLWLPGSDEEYGRAEPTYVGGEREMLDLVAAIAEVLAE